MISVPPDSSQRILIMAMIAVLHDIMAGDADFK